MIRFKKLIFYILLLGYLVVALGFVSGKAGNVVCRNLDINIEDSLSNRFITANQVKDLLNVDNIKTLGYAERIVNTRDLEGILDDQPAIRDAQVYKTIDGTLNIHIEQRTPVLRIMNERNQSYYIDEQGRILPLKRDFTMHTLVANGYIKEPFNPLRSRSIYDKGTDFSDGQKTIFDLFELALFIHNNKFWNDQIEQIYINREHEFELVPRVGAHLIILGPIDDYTYKFKKLYALYKKGFTNVSWNKYEKINLKYKNQVICTKR